jgi:DHA2 family multidrug resistance protein
MLGEHVTIYDPVTQSQFAQIKAGLIAAGTDPVTATQRAYAVLHGMLVQQASMVSFVMLFRALGLLFLVMLPMVLLMKRPARGAGPMAAH